MPRFLASVLAAVALTAFAADPDASFNAGVTAYRSGDTHGALAAFEQAQAEGDDSPPLHFNLGLCYYRLGRFDEASAAFARLRADPGYSYIADFHLGLIAAREGRNAEAEVLWLAVERDAPQSAMRQRARIARSRLTGALDPAANGYLLAAIGRDSNPALLDESVQAADASGATELLGTLSLPLAARDDAVDWLRAGAWLRDYGDADGLDQRGLYAAYAAERARGERRRTAVLEAGITQLDGELFTDTLGATLESEPGPGRGGFVLRGQLSHVGAGPTFEPLAGWRARGELERIARFDHARLRGGYQLELKDRQSDAYSATRHRLTAAIDHGVRRWTVRYQLRWRDSRYADGRDETLLQSGVQARRRLGGSANALLEYQYSRNDSSVDLFDYDRHLTLVGLEWLPRAE
jgi:tetratricopeptide (TPR) repeat protein